MTDETNHAIENGKGWMANIEELLEKFDAAQTLDDDEKTDAIRQEIDESPLSVQVRGDWHTPGDPDGRDPVEFEILLSTGGPALRIIGDLGEHNEPENCRLQWQDWFKPWTDCDITSDQTNTLERFAGFFYFGE